MTQAELNRAVASATGEAVSTIADMGFVLLEPDSSERDPLVVDWDQLDQDRVSVFPQRCPQPIVAA